MTMIASVPTSMGRREIHLHPSGALMLPRDYHEIRALEALAGEGALDLTQAVLNRWRVAFHEGNEHRLGGVLTKVGVEVSNQGMTYLREQLKKRWHRKVYKEQQYRRVQSTVGSFRLRIKTDNVIRHRALRMLQEYFPWLSVVRLESDEMLGLAGLQHLEYIKSYGSEHVNVLAMTIQWWREIGRSGWAVWHYRGKPVIVEQYKGTRVYIWRKTRGHKLVRDCIDRNKLEDL